MKIENSTLAISSQQSFRTEYRKTESLKFWTGTGRPDFEGAMPGNRLGGDTVALGLREQKSDLFTHHAVQKRGGVKGEEEIGDIRLMILEKIIELLTGKKMSIKGIDEANDDGNSSNHLQQTQAQGAGFGLEYDSSEYTYEQESMDFSANGIIKTSDGREIRFDLNLSMEREFYSENHTTLRLGDAVLTDPIVINFNGKAADLSSSGFKFDLNSDGIDENMPMLGRGSGFLAIDLNGNGLVDNGKELFGPDTGNGFAELSRYDGNRDGWIDESDASFDILKIWQGGEGGSLTTLKGAGVGAISLKSVATPFSIKDNENTLLGQVRSSSVYLSQSGTAGVVQQIDIAG